VSNPSTHRTRALAILALLGALAGTAAAGSAALDTVVVLHTNDLHGHISGDDGRRGGVARMAAYVRRARATQPRVLFLDAGDCIAGTPVSTMFRGAPIFEVMSAMGYDAAALGNHEFDHGWRRIAAFREAATFPLLSANAYAPDGELVADRGYLVLELSGVRVGLIGVVTEHTPHMITKRGNRGLAFLPVVPLLRELVPEVRRACDVLILLSHLGSRADRVVAEEVRGIDLIVGGHDHRLIAEPEMVGSTAIVQALHSAAYLGETKVAVDPAGGGVRAVLGRAIPLRDLPGPDPAVAAAVNRWEARVSAVVDVPIGAAEQAWGADRAAAFVEQVMRSWAGADFGFYNEGGVRAGLPAGQVLARHVWMMLPFGNVLATATIEGRHIGGQLGERLRGDGVRLDPGRVYTVATNSFVCERPGTFLGEPDSIEYSDALIRDIVIDHIEREGLGLGP